MERRTEVRAALLLLAAALLTIGGTRLITAESSTPSWQVDVGWYSVILGGGIFGATLVWILKPETLQTGLLRLWWRQRTYAPSSQPEQAGKWPESLSVHRTQRGRAEFQCSVGSPGGGPILSRTFEEMGEQAKTLFPNDFLIDRPLRPPQLPNGIYTVTWRIEERSKHFRARRWLDYSFEAWDRPRWERSHHEVLPEDKGSVRLLFDGNTLGLKCDVRHVASGGLYSTKKGAGFAVGNSSALRFPEDFEGPRPVLAGSYEATWSMLPQSFFGEIEDAFLPTLIDSFTFASEEQP